MYPSDDILFNNREHFLCSRINAEISEIPLLIPPKIKTSIKKPYLQSLTYSFLHFLHPLYL